MKNENTHEPTATGSARRRPTRGDLVALLTWAAHEAGGARGLHADDRDPNGFERAQARLAEMQNRLHEAAGHFPYPRRSPWTSSPNQ